MIKEGQLYAVVDIETTGGKPKDTKVMEIAICVTDGYKILEEYSTLVNPNKPIDYFVTKLTGINNGMVADAPTFGEIAPQVRSMLDGKIFVAHNVDFDYSIIKREFFELNESITLPKLCTVQASKKVFTGLPSYSLSSICSYLEIDLVDAHRALNDTKATCMLLHKLLDTSNIEFLTEEINHQNHVIEFPEHWTIKDLELKSESGVYTCFSPENEIIYIDSSNNIRKSVYQLINNKLYNRINSRKVVEETSYITILYESSKLKAELIALNEIQFQRPKYNKPYRNYKATFGLYLRADQEGIDYLDIKPLEHIDEYSKTTPIIHAATLKNAEKIKRKIMNQPDISKLEILKKQAQKSKDIPEQNKLKTLYNNEFKQKIFGDICCEIKSGYYIFDLYSENEFEGVKIEDFYIKSWGKGSLENNQVTSFSSEFDFFPNQKMTRKYIDLVKKQAYKIIENNEN